MGSRDNRSIPIMGPVDAEYTAECQTPECNKHKALIYRMPLEGWRIGMMILMDPSSPEVGWCPLCKRHNMMVTLCPPLPVPEGPKGFWRLPQK